MLLFVEKNFTKKKKIKICNYRTYYVDFIKSALFFFFYNDTLHALNNARRYVHTHVRIHEYPEHRQNQLVRARKRSVWIKYDSRPKISQSLLGITRLCRICIRITRTYTAGLRNIIISCGKINNYGVYLATSLRILSPLLVRLPTLSFFLSLYLSPSLSPSDNYLSVSCWRAAVNTHKS